MYTDMFRKQRMKINLHMHTTNSDGAMSPTEAAGIYKAAGYDAIALTEHWKYTPSGEIDGMRILSGVEYNTVSHDTAQGVFHILALGCKEEPNLSKDAAPQEMIDEVLHCDGIPVLAHPAWSLNTPEQGLALQNVAFTEIYNSVSDAHNSSRPYSGYFVDTLAVQGRNLALLATDDAHFYDGSDETKSWIMLECGENATDDEIWDAIREQRFYATQGPEVHVWKEGDQLKILCSPAVRISLFSNLVFSPGGCIKGQALTEHTFTIPPTMSFVRVEVIDADGKCAWSNIIDLR